MLTGLPPLTGILDAGCGFGSMARLLAPLGPCLLTGRLTQIQLSVALAPLCDSLAFGWIVGDCPPQFQHAASIRG